MYIRIIAMALFLTSMGVCTDAKPVEWKVSVGGNGHWYEAVADRTHSWMAARKLAEQKTTNGCKGHLATITSAAENSWITSQIVAPSSIDYLWIGGFQNHASSSYDEPSGGWSWVTGETWSYSNWNTGEPNDIRYGDENTGEDYLQILRDGRWNDEQDNIPFDGAFGYVVEYEPVPNPNQSSP